MCVFLFVSIVYLFGNDDVKERYIARYAPVAIAEMHRTGIPASIKLAQALVESNAGSSTLSLNSNNHFGIKCKNYWLGKTYYHIDDDRDENGNLKKSCFRVYDYPVDSYVDHSNFILNSVHYSRLVSDADKDYILWAQGLQAMGYATDPMYGQKLIRIIQKFQLHQYDE